MARSWAAGARLAVIILAEQRVGAIALAAAAAILLQRIIGNLLVAG
jgi:hypothetical protein